ncbi:MAG TPA: hypothetical protein VNR64_15810 [Vicinamibacterales bacterium]|nr:hypothetical protein [Vicinamibacterales bacterium]
MTWDERVTAVLDTAHGLTERQAGFLVTVMLYSGVCMDRQYCAFARIPHGRKSVDFFRLLVDRGYATVNHCRNNSARLFHVHYKPLYAAIEERDSRHRKPTPLPRAIERLMVLDGVLCDRDRVWLGTEQEKLAHFTVKHQIERHDLPSLTFRSADEETVRYFPDKLPIGIDRDGSYTFLYVVTRDGPIDFRTFLERHGELLRTLKRWTVRMLVPKHLARVARRYHAAFREQLATPLRPSNVEDLRWYFRSRRDGGREIDPERFDQAVRAFAAPRFRVLYRGWVERGEPVLDATLSTVVADKLERGFGQVEWRVLPHDYAQLLPLVGTA